MGNDPVSENLYTAAGGLIEASGATPQDIEEIRLLMQALVRLREAEQILSEASRRYMKLSAQDMKALHYLIVAKRLNQIVTPSVLATHLGISPASTTKLLNRLERGNHIVRRMHPADRRAFIIEVTPETEMAAKETVGEQQTRRFYAAARLTSEERAAVTRFLHDMADELALSNATWAQHLLENG